ncbi:MAG: FAD-dependent monooxygenase [Anaerolineae bacterium]|nr:FAD-dependent monooxygenase [Anaerolineae bacterium]
MADKHFDVIIIGGRSAGSSLAIRLGREGVRVLLVDKATFPSLPAVPSSPIIHPGTMRLIDELGIPEAAYGLEGSQATHYVLNFVNHFEVALPMSITQLDRPYVRGIDRTHFDTLLWENACKTPNVTSLDGFSVTRILKEGARVNGVGGKNAQGEEVTFTADVVVGADGRFSFAAPKFGAEIIEEYGDNPTASFHAEWEDVEDYSGDYPQAVCMYNTLKNSAVLCIPIARRKYIIAIYMRSDAAQFGAQGLEDGYLKMLQSITPLWKRLKNARKVTEVIGVKRITNGYRQGTGPGWALVGDALHYKDPLDGQGIYDALIEAKLLAQAIVRWKCQGVAWDTVTVEYEAGVKNETHAMFLQTVARVKQEMFTTPPPFIVNTLIRWMLNDPAYQATFLKYLSRAIPPEQFSVKPTISPMLILQGISHDLQHRFSKS